MKSRKDKTMKIGLIDLGSNSARMYMTEVREGTATILARRRVMTRLSEGMGEEKRLTEAAMARTLKTLSNFADELRQEGAVPFAVATAAVRQACNRADFLSRAERECGLRIHVLSGESEAFFDFCGVTASLPDCNDCLICDTGGGSSELILAKGGRICGKVSLPFGAMSLTNRYGAEILAAKDDISAQLDRVSFLEEAVGLPLVGIGGSVCAFGALDGAGTKIHAHAITAERCQELFDALYPLSPSERMNMGVESGRADTICAGFYPSLLLLQRLSMPKLILCTAGLREGILAELTKEKTDFYAKNQELFLEKYV